MSAAKVLVVEHQGNAGIGQLAERLRDGGIEMVTVGPDTGAPVPDSAAGYDGVIVLGGSMGPTDDERAPWLPAVRRLLSDSVAAEVPTLGVCLGAQLLATATGGNVRTNPKGPEVGLSSVAFGEDAAGDPLFGALAGSDTPVVQWHYLEADVLPEGSTLLASGPECSNQAFRLGAAAWGVQFHPEALGDSAERWTEDEPRGLRDLGLDGSRVVAGIRAAEPELREVWGGLGDRFAALVAARSVG